MKRNMGSVDRSLRGIAVPVLVVISFTIFGVGSALGIVALVVAAIFLATAVTGFCPTYTLFGMSTRGGLTTRHHPSGFGWHRTLPQQ
jgi:hypothetical protein